MDDLKYLIKALEELRESAADAIRLRHQKSRDARFAEAARTYSGTLRSNLLEDDWWIEDWEARQEDSLVEVVQSIAIRLRAEHKDFGRVVEGPAEGVLGEIDLTDLLNLRLSMGKNLYSGGTPAIQIRMNHTNGVEVEIRDQGSDWVRIAESRLKMSITKHRPWYWWMRSTWMAFLLFFLPVHVLARSLFARGGGLGVSGEMVLGVMEAAVVIGLYTLWQKLLPGFELYKVGSRARGAKALAMIGTLVLSVAGILIPLLIPSSK